MTCSKDPESIEKETRLEQAVAEYKRRQKTPNPATIRCIAKVPRSSIQNRLNGVLARNKAQEPLMNLTNVEEMELVQWITTLTQRGYAPRYRTVRELAEIIRNQRVISVNDEDIQLVKYEEFGKAWVARFMARHPQLESARRKCIEAARIKDVSVEHLTKWFEDLEWIVDEHNIDLKISTTWMKADLLSAILRHHNVLSTLQFVRSFKQNLDIRNGLQWWNAFVHMEVSCLR